MSPPLLCRCTIPGTLAPMTTHLASERRVADLVGRLLGAVDPLADGLTARIFDGEYAYAESTLLSPAQLRGAVYDNLRTLLMALQGEPVSLDAARAAGRLKAEQGIPLAALLHAFRLAGRFIWDHLLAAAEEEGSATELLPVASDVWLLIDEFSSAAADAYRATTEEHARRDAEVRGMLLTSLLDGSTAGSARAWEILRMLRLDSHRTLLVVSAETGGPLAAELRLRASGVAGVWIQQIGARVGLIGVSGEHAAATVAGRLAEAAEARIGISRPFSSPVEVPAAWRQAQLASRCLPPGVHGVHVYGSSPIALLAAASPETATEVAGAVLGPLLDLPEQERTVLLDTLDAWYTAGGSTARAAERLHCHRNTVLYRINRVMALTGRSTADAAASAELYIALRALRIGG